MVRKIIKIDEERCDGCGICAGACHEGAIGIVDGKAKLLREDYCDGLGDCLPACPVGAISFEEREAPAYDEAAVRAAKLESAAEKPPRGCPGTTARAICRRPPAENTAPVPSRLAQWPVQLRLVPEKAPYFDGAHLLVAADCTAYAYGNFHNDFIKDKIAVIGCPKLDMADHAEKLTRIIAGNRVAGVTVVRMEVPCCGGLVNAVRQALERSGKSIPLSVVTITTDGQIRE